jgi:hypothetical protein
MYWRRIQHDHKRKPLHAQQPHRYHTPLEIANKHKREHVVGPEAKHVGDGAFVECQRPFITQDPKEAIDSVLVLPLLLVVQPSPA